MFSSGGSHNLFQIISYRDKLILDVAAELCGGERVPCDPEGDGEAGEEEEGTVAADRQGVASFARRALSSAAASTARNSAFGYTRIGEELRMNLEPNKRSNA